MKRLIQIAALFIFAGIVLGAIPAKEVKIIPVTVSPITKEPIKESDDVVFRLHKGNYVPIKFEDAYRAMLDKSRKALIAEERAKE